jgi:glyoxylase-like metal-dependent hydrolase (beta-lactamase superfamily II)
MTTRVAVLSLLVLGGVALLIVRPDAAQRPRPPGAEFKGDAFRLNKIQDGIYHAVGTGALSVGCNAAVIVNRDDVLVVDSHSTPAAAWALAEQIKTVTDKPIRYVINTHFHWDHAHGNQVYGSDVEIIGHEFTRRMLAAGESTRGRSYDMFVTSGIPVQIAQLTKQIDGMPDGPAKDKVREQLSIQQQYREASAAVKVQPPTVTLTDSMTLYRGGREIRLQFLGRGHTGGDVVVYLPKERVVASGDLLTAGPSYLGDAFVPDWSATLDKLRALDFDWVLPGHGEAFQGKAKIDQFKSYLADFWQQAKKLHDSGVSAEEAARQIDMRKHIADYPEVPALKDVGVLNHGVYRAYDLLEGRMQ